MMKKIIVIFLALVFLCGNAWAVDKFVNYKNVTSASHSSENTSVTPDVNYALKQGYINTYELTANTNKEITVPTGSEFAVFAANADLWVRVGTTAAVVPSGDTTDGTGSELNPSTRYLGSETKINMISASAALVSIMFYK